MRMCISLLCLLASMPAAGQVVLFDRDCMSADDWYIGDLGTVSFADCEMSLAPAVLDGIEHTANAHITGSINWGDYAVTTRFRVPTAEASFESWSADGHFEIGFREGSGASSLGLNWIFSGGEIFTTLHEAKVLIEMWRRHYNQVRPHSSLGYRPPAPEAAPGKLVGALKE